MGRIHIPAVAGWHLPAGTTIWTANMAICDRNLSTGFHSTYTQWGAVDLGYFYSIKYVQTAFESAGGSYTIYKSEIPSSNVLDAYNNKTEIINGSFGSGNIRLYNQFAESVFRWLLIRASHNQGDWGFAIWELSPFQDSETAKFQILDSAGQPLNLSAADRALGNVYLNYPEGDTLPGGFPDRKFRETAGQITLAYQTGKIKRYIKNIASNPMTNIIATKMTNSGDSSADEIMSLSDSENGTYGSSVTYPGPVAANGTVELWVKTDATNMGIAQIGKHYNNIQILGTEQIP